MVFKQVGDRRPYPDHARTGREWADIPPRPVRLDQLITTKNVLDVRTVLATDSTFYGDLFPHVISWRGELYLEDALHRAAGRPAAALGDPRQGARAGLSRAVTIVWDVARGSLS